MLHPALAATALLFWTAASAQPRQEAVRFNLQIRPLLSDRCFKCHGQDERARKAGLRLDTRDGATAALPEGMTAIRPGDPAASEMVRRIASADPGERMPPPGTQPPLSGDEIELVRRWIREGAEYQGHWAFLPVRVAPPPGAAGPEAGNPIDAFIDERLRREGLEAAPEASRETLIRRLSFDLAGLPPSLEEIDAFLGDSSPDAYDRAVEKYLDSPAFGERMAGDWLDVARYADTYGYQSDVDRDMSPWRDWVIRAINENLPYDRFILWQIAGDLLPEASRDQILATAFNRLHRQTNEGGSIEEEFRAEYVADRIHTMGTAFLGLTLECSRCHDHKYDPISQKDYYRLSAYFNRIDESGLYSHFTRAVPTPTLLLYPPGAREKHLDLKARIGAAEERLQSAAASASAGFEAWLQANGGAIEPPEPSAWFPFETIAGGKSPNLAAPKSPAVLHDGPAPAEGRIGKALQFSGDNSIECPQSGEFRRFDPFSFSLWIKPAETAGRAVVLHRSRAWTDSGSRGYELLLEDGRPAFNLVHFWPGNAIGSRARQALPAGEWAHIAITYDGSSRASGLAIYINGRKAPADSIRDHLYKDIIHRGEWGDADAGGIHLTLAGRFRDAGFRNGNIDELRVYGVRLTDLEAAALAGSPAPPPAAGASEEVRGAWLQHYLNRRDAGYAAALDDLKRLRREENDLVNDVPEIMVMADMAQPRRTFLLKRGAYNAPGEEVEAGVPERIFALPENAPANRLGLGRWMIDPRNPLTARVAVNRIWKIHFGRGLAAKVEDLGSQGQPPSHPELLDWLAARFVESGWDRKALHRLIVQSRAYRRSSLASPELAARDPDNLLLARGPKHRLSAEQIRDGALAASGLLDRRIGGRSVFPYQPAGLWEESGTGKSYQPSKGADLRRRSLYTFWRRTAPPPSMLTFDATSREVCTARRETTATPLQSLILLNDPQFVEASRALAERVLRKYGDDFHAALQETFRLLTGRRPSPRESAILERLREEQARAFEADAPAAEKFLSVGDLPRDPSLPAVSAAAMAAVANALMNYDEFIMKR